MYNFLGLSFLPSYLYFLMEKEDGQECSSFKYLWFWIIRDWNLSWKLLLKLYQNCYSFHQAECWGKSFPECIQVHCICWIKLKDINISFHFFALSLCRGLIWSNPPFLPCSYNIYYFWILQSWSSIMFPVFQYYDNISASQCKNIVHLVHSKPKYCSYLCLW